MIRTWLITGSGSGLGRAIAEAVLFLGDRVVAGSRRPEELNALKEQYGELINPIDLDVEFARHNWPTLIV